MQRYESELRDKMKFLLESFTDDLDEIIRELGSVDITVALEIFSELKNSGYMEICEIKRQEFDQARKLARKQTSEFIYNMPSANIMFSQWWFTIDTIEKLCFEIKKRTLTEVVNTL